MKQINPVERRSPSKRGDPPRALDERPRQRQHRCHHCHVRAEQARASQRIGNRVESKTVAIKPPIIDNRGRDGVRAGGFQQEGVISCAAPGDEKHSSGAGTVPRPSGNRASQAPKRFKTTRRGMTRQTTPTVCPWHADRAALWHNCSSELSNDGRFHPAQQDSCVTSLLKVCAHSFSPSTMVR